jgi:hypothetical protein
MKMALAAGLFTRILIIKIQSLFNFNMGLLTPDNSIIKIFIFYDKSSWHTLLTGLIKSFLHQENIHIHNYSVYLSIYRGDHVIIVIEPVTNKQKLLHKFTLSATQFLKEKPSVCKKTKYPIKDFFMDYPTNTVFSDIENPVLKEINKKNIEDIEGHFSDTLISALSTEEIDVEVICTFLIYIQAGIIKALYPQINNAVKNIVELLQEIELYWIKSDEKTATEYHDALNYHSLFENNDSIILEIIDDVWKVATPELDWLNKWVSVCQLYLHKNDFKDSFIFFSNIAFKHSGLVNPVLPIVSANAIKRALKSYDSKRIN